MAFQFHNATVLQTRPNKPQALVRLHLEHAAPAWNLCLTKDINSPAWVCTEVCLNKLSKPMEYTILPAVKPVLFARP